MTSTLNPDRQPARKTSLVQRLLVILFCVLFTLAIALAGSQGGATVMIAGNTVPILMLCAALSFAINWVIFFPSWLAQTEHYFDLTGSVCFISLSLLALMLSPAADLRATILAMLVCLWALRLGSFLFLRVRQDGSDGRFDAIKPVFSRFLVTWTVQAVWVFVTSAAALTAITSAERVAMDLLSWLGVVLWLTGFGIEVTADRQKRRFRSDPANSGRFIQSGLWAWSRHPNYFGEIVLWLGVALVAAPALQGWQLLALISPVFVILLLTRVSGIPLLEARARQRWGHDPEWQAYQQRTSRLIPRPPAS